jgi:hypothetical protein
MSRLQHGVGSIPVEDLAPAISDVVDDFTSSEVSSNEEAVIGEHASLVIALVPSVPVPLLVDIGRRMEGVSHDLCLGVALYDLTSGVLV